MMADAALEMGIIPRGAFFSSAEVISRMDKSRLRNLRKFGAFVRRASKSSLRYSKKGKSSTAGSPPKVHRSDRFTRSKVNKKTGKTTKRSLSPLRELIFFTYDAQTESVVVGPMGFRDSKAKQRTPGVLEKGGTILVNRRTPMKAVISGDIRKGIQRTPMKLAARPFMVPAAKQEMPKFPQLFKGDM